MNAKLYLLQREIDPNSWPTEWQDLLRGPVAEVRAAYYADARTPAGYLHDRRILDALGRDVTRLVMGW